MAATEIETIDKAFTFLEDGSKLRVSFPNVPVISFRDYAKRFFQDKTEEGSRFFRGIINGPLLRQAWADGDAERMLSVWVTILRYMGDLPPKSNMPLTNLESVQLITNIAITRPHARDEIYCQVIKQLHDNPNQTSRARGWVLLSILLGIFLPSDSLLVIVQEFVLQGPPAYRGWVLDRLERTFNNGTRTRPATALDVLMSFKKHLIPIETSFGTGKVDVPIDPATLASEVIEHVYRTGSVAREPGFAVYLTSTIGDKLVSLGGGNYHVLDAIFAEERRLSRAVGTEWQRLASERSYSFLVRKEMFAPWMEGRQNVDLIYAQIIDGMRNGFYRIPDSAQLERMYALVYGVDHGHVLNDDKAKALVTKYDFHGTERKSVDHWTRAIKASFDELMLFDVTLTPEDLKADVVAYARSTWYLEFSRTFKKVKATFENDVPQECSLYINADGMYVVEPSKEDSLSARKDLNVLFKARFIHMFEISTMHEKAQLPDTTPSFHITLVHPPHTRLSIESDDALLIRQLVHSYHQGLLNRSKYCMAALPYRAPSADSSFLSFGEGDLIILPKIWRETDQGGWARGIAEKTKLEGDFPAANVMVLPCIQMPDAETLESFRVHVKALGMDDGYLQTDAL